MAERFRYQPEWEGPLSGRSFEKQTEDAINGLWEAIESGGGGGGGSGPSPSNDPPQAPGTASAGASTLYSRGDHVHPEQVDVGGNASTATKLKTPRAITLAGDVQGEAYFDGSRNIVIETTADVGTTVSPSDALPQAPGTASAGVSEEYSRGDHVHPEQVFPVDSALDGTSANPVRNSAIVTALAGKVGLTGDETVSGAKTFTQGPYGASAAVAEATIDLSTGVVFTKTVSANTTFTFTGVPAGAAATFSLILTNGGAYRITWPDSVRWSGGQPQLLTAGGVDVLTFITADGGVTWYGAGSLEDAL